MIRPTKRPPARLATGPRRPPSPHHRTSASGTDRGLLNHRRNRAAMMRRRRPFTAARGLALLVWTLAVVWSAGVFVVVGMAAIGVGLEDGADASLPILPLFVIPLVLLVASSSALIARWRADGTTAGLMAGRTASVSMGLLAFVLTIATVMLEADTAFVALFAAGVVFGAACAWDSYRGIQAEGGPTRVST